MNEAVLYDSSVWIDFLNKRVTPQTVKLEQAIERNSDEVLVCPPVLQEVLQGIRDDARYERIKRSLLAFRCLPGDPVEVAVEAAELYRALRKVGITIRKANDCLIARYAVRADVPVSHADEDFDRIAAHFPLRST